MVKLVYDEAKRLANIDKHGVDFADLTHDFFIFDGSGINLRL